MSKRTEVGIINASSQSWQEETMSQSSTPPAAPSNRRRPILIGVALALLAFVTCVGLFLAAQRLTAPSTQAPAATMSVAEAAQATVQAGVQPTTMSFDDQVATAVAATQAAGQAAPTEPPSVVEAPPAATTQPVGQPPQPQQRHPTQYLETGVGNTKSWSFNIAPDEVLIAGGWAVDGTSSGVYKAWPGSQSVTTSVTDGFALLIKKEWARDEFCFRVAQAVQYNWAHGTVTPLPGWNACQ